MNVKAILANTKVRRSVEIGAGLVAGFFVGFKTAQHTMASQFAEQFENEKAALERSYARKAEATRVVGEKPDLEALVEVVEYEDIVSSYSPSDEEEESDDEEDESVAQDEEVETPPANVFNLQTPPHGVDETVYVIGEYEFMDGVNGYEQINLTYYEADDVLADDKDQLVDDVSRLIGDNALNSFGVGTGDPDTVFVRNDNIDVVFEITRVNGSYSELVLGYTEPKPKVKSKRMPKEE